MFSAFDKTTIQGEVKIKLNYKLKEGEEITYISPGETVFTRNDGLKFAVDWSDSVMNYETDQDGNMLITFNLFSLDNDMVKDQLLEAGLDELVKEDRYGLSLFNNVADANMETIVFDINEIEINVDNLIETIIVNIFDPISKEGIVF